MKILNRTLIMIAAVLVAFSCEDPDLAPIVTFDSAGKGAYPDGATIAFRSDELGGVRRAAKRFSQAGHRAQDASTHRAGIPPRRTSRSSTIRWATSRHARTRRTTTARAGRRSPTASTTSPWITRGTCSKTRSAPGCCISGPKAACTFPGTTGTDGDS